MKTLAAAALTLALTSSALLAAEPAWPGLTLAEQKSLARELGKRDKGSVTVACAGSWCRKLAGDIETVFRGAQWHVTHVHGGGLGISGVQGLRVNSCGVQPREVQAVIQATTTRKIEAISDGDCATGDREVYVIVGEIPE